MRRFLVRVSSKQDGKGTWTPCPCLWPYSSEGTRPKEMEREKKCLYFFFATLEYISPHEGECYLNHLWCTFFKEPGMWGLGRQSRCQAGTEWPPPSSQKKKKKKKKTLVSPILLLDQIFILFHFGSHLNKLSVSKLRLQISQGRFLCLINCFDWNSKRK